MLVGAARGLLSPATAAHRLDFIGRARSATELGFSHGDLPAANPWAVRLVRALARAPHQPASATPPPALAVIELRPEYVFAATATVVLGRAPECEVVVADPSVSRQHAVLRRCGTDVLVKDLGSANGTWLNSRRVRRAVLKPGDHLLVGNLRVVIDVDR